VQYFQRKKVKLKMIQCLESPIEPKGIRFDPFLNFGFFFFTEKAIDGKNVAPSLGLSGSLVGA